MKYGFWSCGKSIHASTCFIWVVLIQDQSKPWHLVLLPPFQIGCMSDLIVPLSKCLYVWLECPPFSVYMFDLSVPLSKWLYVSELIVPLSKWLYVWLDCPPFTVVICMTIVPFQSGSMCDFTVPLSKWFYVWHYCLPFKVVIRLTCVQSTTGITHELIFFFFCCWPKGRDIFSFVYHKVF